MTEREHLPTSYGNWRVYPDLRCPIHPGETIPRERYPDGSRWQGECAQCGVAEFEKAMERNDRESETLRRTRPGRRFEAHPSREDES